jgi:hypothetical protein
MPIDAGIGGVMALTLDGLRQCANVLSDRPFAISTI